MGGEEIAKRGAPELEIGEEIPDDVESLHHWSVEFSRGLKLVQGQVVLLGNIEREIENALASNELHTEAAEAFIEGSLKAFSIPVPLCTSNRYRP